MLQNYRFSTTEEYINPSSSSSGNVQGSHVTLVDACGFGREGLRAALYQHFPSSGPIDVKMGVASELPRMGIKRDERKDTTWPHFLVLRLPFSSTEALHLLLQLITLPAGYYERVVILSAVSPDKVRRMLISTGLTGQICLADDRLTLSALCRVIAPVRWEGKRDAGCHYEVLLRQPHRQFTPSEWRVLSQTLQGVSVREQARQAGTRIKTIYAQRASGLHKLKVRDISMLLRQFWPVRNRMSKENPE